MIDLTETPLTDLFEQAKAVEPADADADIKRRTLLAWLKAKESKEYSNPIADPALVLFEGKLYSGVADGKKVLAVYRVRNDRQLKRLRRIPLAVCAGVVLRSNGKAEQLIDREK